MFGAEEDIEEHKIKIKFEKRDKVEKEPFIMFLENFCQIFGLNIENLKDLKYDFKFCYIDSDEDCIIVQNNEDFDIFYISGDLDEKKSTTRYLFLGKDEKEGNDIIKVYDDIIKNENFKNISITVYINEDIEEEKKRRTRRKKRRK